MKPISASTRKTSRSAAKPFSKNPSPASSGVDGRLSGRPGRTLATPPIHEGGNADVVGPVHRKSHVAGRLHRHGHAEGPHQPAFEQILFPPGVLHQRDAQAIDG